LREDVDDDADLPLDKMMQQKLSKNGFLDELKVANKKI